MSPLSAPLPITKKCLSDAPVDVAPKKIISEPWSPAESLRSFKLYAKGPKCDLIRGAASKITSRV